ncbi:hypothetical protein [[Eubacterium] hominis]|uniref:hypothetical protein n=1 Tax=[Eubacterium] hominis TaxID=2764325 RepID=UPI003A4E51AA
MKKKEKRKIIILLLFVVILMVIGYITVYPVVLPLYQLRLFTLKPTVYSVYLNVFMLFMCILSCTKLICDFKVYKYVSSLIVLYINILYFIPGFLMNLVYDTDIYFMNYYALFWIGFIFAHKIVIVLGKKNPQPVLIKLNLKSYKWFYNTGIVIVFCTFSLVVSLFFNGGRISITNLFNLDEVLESRAASSQLNIHWLIWYPIVCASMILPIWITLAYKNKKYWMIAFITITILSMYSIGANRSFLFMLGFAIIFSFYKDDDLLLIKIMVFALVLVCIERYLNNGYPVMNIIRRLTITPNGESRFYVDFFQQNVPDLAKQILERWLHPLGINSNYDLRISAAIGNTYLNGSNCNNGLVGYAIANYGSLGIIIGPILYALSFRLIDKIMKKITYKKMLHVTAIVFALQITNSYGWAEYLILPSFLLLFYLLMLFMPSVKGNDEQ